MTIRILGIESSCDETAAAVVADGQAVLSNVISSQADLHRRYGGVVPELASRQHLEAILPVIREALSEAATAPADLDAIAVTRGPGLVGALLVGVMVAKALAFAWQKPLIGVHHLAGHIAANFLRPDPPGLPALCLVVSGAHADLIHLDGAGRARLIGRTLDDAAGEAFDKVARLLGLPYPGGPEIDRLAKEGDPAAIAFPRALLGQEGYDFSFSGLKTAVAVHLEKENPGRPADVAASFQQAVIDVLVRKTWQAVDDLNVMQVMMAGGVAANSALRAAMKSEADRRGVRLDIPPPILCTDNGAMIAAAGYRAFLAGERAGLDLDVAVDLPLDGVGGTRLAGPAAR